jgi:uncharacterized protein (TIRG00374 family)
VWEIKRSTVTHVSSFVFGIAVLIVFVYYVGIGSIESILLSVHPLVIVAMVGLQFLSLTFYALAWYLLIRSAGYRMPYLTCQGITLASIFAVYTMPSGVFLEGARCILCSKETGMKLGESTATVILHRMLYIIGFLGSTAFALFALTTIGGMNFIILEELSMIPTVSVIGLIVALYLSLDPKRVQPILDHLLRFALPIIRLVQKRAVVDGKVDRFLGAYQLSFRRMLSDKLQVVLSFAASLGDWGCSVIILWFVLASMEAHVSLWAVMITMAIGKMIQMTPIAIPGMIGVYEATVTSAMAVFAIPIPIALSAALLTRIVTVWLELPVTGVAAYHYGFKLLTHGKLNN